MFSERLLDLKLHVLVTFKVALLDRAFIICIVVLWYFSGFWVFVVTFSGTFTKDLNKFSASKGKVWITYFSTFTWHSVFESLFCIRWVILAFIFFLCVTFLYFILFSFDSVFFRHIWQVYFCYLQLVWFFIFLKLMSCRLKTTRKCECFALLFLLSFTPLIITPHVATSFASNRCVNAHTHTQTLRIQ